MLHRISIYRHCGIFLFLFGFVGICATTCPTRGAEPAKTDQTNPTAIIKKKLKRPNLPNYHDAPLNKVIAEIAKEADVKITLDPQALADEGISEDTPITLMTKHELMLKSTLNLILDPLHLMYEIEGDAIVIISETQFDARIIKCKYNIADAATSPAEVKKIVAKMRAMAERDAPKGTVKEENIVAFKDGKQILVAQVPRVQCNLRRFIIELRGAKNRDEEIEKDPIFDSRVILADYRYDSDE